jgi:hypothetical protein
MIGAFRAFVAFFGSIPSYLLLKTIISIKMSFEAPDAIRNSPSGVALILVVAVSNLRS